MADAAVAEAMAPWRCIGVDRLLRALRGKAVGTKRKLSNGAKLAALEIANFNLAFFSVHYLAELLECDESTARGYCTELVNAGVIERDDEGRAGTTNIYRMLIDVTSSLEISSTTPPQISPRKRRGSKPTREAAGQDVGENSPASSDLQQLQEKLEAAADQLEPETEAEKTQRQAFVKPALPGGPSLKGCRPSDLLPPALIQSLSQIPNGEAALRLLERRKLAKDYATALAQRVVDYHNQKGVRDAVKFLQVILQDEPQTLLQQPASNNGSPPVPDGPLWRRRRQLMDALDRLELYDIRRDKLSQELFAINRELLRQQQQAS